MSQMEYAYFLEVTNPNNLIQEIEVSSDTSFGSSRDCDLALPGQGLSPIQGKFRVQNDILTYIQMSEDEMVKIGKQICKKGRMYILDQGDQITTQQKASKKEKLKILIRKEEKEQDNDEDEELQQDQPQTEFSENDPTQESIQAKLPGDNQEPNIDEDFSLDIDEEDVDQLIENSLNKADEETEGFLDSNILHDKVNDEDNEDDEADNSAERVKAAKEKRIQQRTASKIRIAHKQKGKKKYREYVTGILPRFLGMFYNIFIFILFYFQILPEIEKASGIKFSIISKDLFDFVTPYLNKVPEKIATIPHSEIVLSQLKTYLASYEHFNIIMLFIVYEIITHLILGVGLGQFFLGLRPKGNFLVVRLLSPIRLLFYGLTFPLLIFDLPIIINRKSFKEVITFTSIISKSKKMLIFNSLITLPLFILLFCNYELALYQSSGSPMMDKEVIDVPIAKARGKKGEALFKIDLPAFHLHSKSPLNLKEIIIPTVEIRESKYLAKLIVYRPKQKGSIRIYQSKSVLPITEVVSILRQDPLNIGNFDNYSGNDITLPADTNSKVMESLYQVMTFDYTNPLPLLETVGLVTNPYQKIYNQILFNIPMIYPNRSTLLKGPFETLVTMELSGPTYQLSLINLTSQGHIQTLFEFEPKLRSNAIDLISKTWAIGNDNSTGKKTGIQLLTKLKGQEKPNIILGAFSSINSLVNLIRSEEISKLEFSNLTNTFLQLSYHSLKTEDQVLQNMILDEMETLDKWLLLQDKRNKKQSLSEFRLGLLRIQKALEGKEEKFFKINKVK